MFGGSERSGRILGGSITKTGDFPYMALIGSINKIDGKVQYTCGGSLINKWYVLTAATCLYNENGTLAIPE
jgi:secreted trypsin-like serine protease